MHVTVKYLGEVGVERVAAIEQAVEASVHGARPFTLAVDGFGAFPSARHPRVFWVGCSPDPGLELLQHHVEERFAGLGFPKEHRPFRPHVTVGRAKDRRNRDAGALRELGGTLPSLEVWQSVTVRSLDLMESHLDRSGARYELKYRAELAGE